MKNQLRHKIGIIGVGFVGGAMKKYFKSRRAVLFLYDKFKKIGSVEEINKADTVFICVPTPYKPKKGFDISAVISAIRILQSPKIIVIKSSIIPGTTEKLQKKFPQHKFFFNPEFLREASPYRDLVSPSRQLVGYTAKSKALAKSVMSLLPKAPYTKIMKAGEAEMVKYMANAFLSLKVVYANQFYALCRKCGIDYAPVGEALGKDPRIGDSHFNVHRDGYFGYGGSCFPKDVNAIIELGQKAGSRLELLETMRKINRQLLKSKGLSENYFLLDFHKNKGSRSR